MAIVHRFENTEASALGLAAVVEGHTDFDYTPGPNDEKLDPMHFVMGAKAPDVRMLVPGDFVVELDQPRRVVLVPAEAFEAIGAYLQAELAAEAEGSPIGSEGGAVVAFNVTPSLEGEGPPLRIDPPKVDQSERYAREETCAEVRSGYADPRFRNRGR
jgi:hypothetical protein